MVRRAFLRIRINRALKMLHSKNSRERSRAGNFLSDIIRDPNIPYNLAERTFSRVAEQLNQGRTDDTTKELLSIALAVAEHYGATESNGCNLSLTRILQSLRAPVILIAENDRTEQYTGELAAMFLAELDNVGLVT